MTTAPEGTSQSRKAPADHDPGWIGVYLRTLGAALALVALILGAQGLLDRIARDTEDRLAYRQWVADACTPGTNESAVAINDGKRIRCTIYSRVGYGLATEVVSAAVMEVPL
jgi:hypothetical protein